MEVSQEQLKQAMVKAYESGNTEAAKLFANKLSASIRDQQINFDLDRRANLMEKGLENIPSDLARLGGQAIGYALSPVETAKKAWGATKDIASGVTKLGQGAFSKAYPNISERIMSPETRQQGEQVAEAVGKGVSNYLFDPKTRMIAEEEAAQRPATALLDIALGTKGTGKLFSLAGKTDIAKDIKKVGETIDPTSFISKPMQKKVISKAADLKGLEQQNIFVDAITKKGVDAGYKITPKEAANPSWWKKTQQTIVGSDTLTQKIVAENQDVTNKLARQYLGLPKNTPLGDNVLSNVKAKYKPMYDKIENLKSVEYTQAGRDIAGTPTQKTLRTRSGKQILDDLQQARTDSKKQWGRYVRSEADAGIKNKALAYDSMVKKYEDELLDLANKSGSPELVDELRKSRIDYAKAYTVDKALNPSTGNVNAQVFSDIARSGGVLSDEGKLIADFATQHRNLSRTPLSETPTFMNKFDSILIGQNVARGNWLPSGLPFLKIPVGMNLMRQGVTESLAAPKYTPSLLERFLGNPDAVTTAVGVPSLLERREERNR